MFVLTGAAGKFSINAHGGGRHCAGRMSGQGLGKSQIVQLALVVAPAFPHFDPALQVDLCSQQLLAVQAGGGGNLFQHLAAFADHHTLVALFFAGDGYRDVDQVLCRGRSLKESTVTAMPWGTSLPRRKSSGLFPHQFRHQFLFRQVGIGVVVKNSGGRGCRKGPGTSNSASQPVPSMAERGPAPCQKRQAPPPGGARASSAAKSESRSTLLMTPTAGPAFFQAPRPFSALTR